MEQLKENFDQDFEEIKGHCCCYCCECTPIDRLHSIGYCDELGKHVNLHSVDEACPNQCFEIEDYMFELTDFRF